MSSDQEGLNAERYVEHLRSLGQVPASGFPRGLAVVLGAAPRVWSRKSSSTAFGQLRLSPSGGVGLLGTALAGSPSAAVLVTCCAALGVREIIVVGRGGRTLALGATDSPPHVMVLDSAVGDDATSVAYGREDRVHPNQSLTDRVAAAAESSGLSPARSGTFSTDVPFLVAGPRLELVLAAGGVVEMEATTLFAAASSVGLDLAEVIVISDTRTGDDWLPRSPAHVSETMNRLARMAISVLEQGSGVSS
ncbi:MAG: phosphorylase family protein [Acidimicrobiales bacterium]|jgi:uridine phosphorylase